MTRNPSVKRSARVSDLRNLGAKSQKVLALSGMTTLAQLRIIGAVAADARAKQADAKVRLNLLWALEGALTGESSQTVARDHRTSMLLALEEFQRRTERFGDVFVLPQHRRKGYSKQLIEAVLAHPDLQGLRRFSLATTDAHGLYSRFGFSPLANPHIRMERHRSSIYKPAPYRESNDCGC